MPQTTGVKATERKLLWRALKVLWICACIAVFVHSLVIRNGETQEAEVIEMLALSWPAGFLGLCVVLIGNPTLQTYWVVLLWIPFFVFGYLQWFILVPFAARWIRYKFGDGSLISLNITPRA